MKFQCHTTSIEIVFPKDRPMRDRGGFPPISSLRTHMVLIDLRRSAAFYKVAAFVPFVPFPLSTTKAQEKSWIGSNWVKKIKEVLNTDLAENA